MVKGVLCLKTRLLFGSTLVLTYAICNLSTLFIAGCSEKMLTFSLNLDLPNNEWKRVQILGRN